MTTSSRSSSWSRWTSGLVRWALGLSLAAGASAGCDRHRATAADCTRIFHRLVEVELLEQGFHDPVLLQRRAGELERKLAPELASCPGRPLSTTALDCIGRAPNAEALIHGCLK